MSQAPHTVNLSTSAFFNFVSAPTGFPPFRTIPCKVKAPDSPWSGRSAKDWWCRHPPFSFCYLVCLILFRAHPPANDDCQLLQNIGSLPPLPSGRKTRILLFHPCESAQRPFFSQFPLFSQSSFRHLAKYPPLLFLFLPFPSPGQNQFFSEMSFDSVIFHDSVGFPPPRPPG